MEVLDRSDRRWLLGVQNDGKATTKICITENGRLCVPAGGPAAMLYGERLSDAFIVAVNAHLKASKAGIVDIAMASSGNTRLVVVSAQHDEDDKPSETRFTFDGRIAPAK